jgi:hypothetical protein
VNPARQKGLSRHPAAACPPGNTATAASLGFRATGGSQGFPNAAASQHAWCRHCAGEGAGHCFWVELTRALLVPQPQCPHYLDDHIDRPVTAAVTGHGNRTCTGQSVTRLTGHERDRLIPCVTTGLRPADLKVLVQWQHHACLALHARDTSGGGLQPGPTQLSPHGAGHGQDIYASERGYVRNGSSSDGAATATCTKRITIFAARPSLV